MLRYILASALIATVGCGGSMKNYLETNARIVQCETANGFWSCRPIEEKLVCACTQSTMAARSNN